MQKHIAVNTRVLLSGKLDGIGRFAVEVLQRIVLANPEIQFSFLFDRPYDQQFIFNTNVTPYVIPPQSRHPVLWYIWFHHTVQYKLNQIKPDLFFSPEFYLSPLKHIPLIPVFHDLAYEHYPQDIPAWAARYCQKYSPYYASIAHHLITVSEYSKHDIITQYQLPEDKISVVYNGAGELFVPQPAEMLQKVRAKYAQDCRYFLFVGTIQPRKNIETLLQAFDVYKSRYPSTIKLVIAGRKGWNYQEAIEAYQLMQYRDEVVFTGYLEEKELPGLYAASIGLCYIPYLEGFGIPLLEAMYCDTAVLCSNMTAIPEVVGDAAWQVDPFDVEQIVVGMHTLAEDTATRSGLIVKGKKQREKFSWDKTAKRTWEVLSKHL